MNPTVLPMVASTLGLDVFGQVAFKLGLDAIEGSPAGWAFWSRLLRQPWLLLGIAAYVVEFFVWLAVLSEVELSLAFPLASLSYCGVMAAGSWVFGEPVSCRRWAGCGLITVGAALVCAS